MLKYLLPLLLLTSCGNKDYISDAIFDPFILENSKKHCNNGEISKIKDHIKTDTKYADGYIKNHYAIIYCKDGAIFDGSGENYILMESEYIHYYD